MTAVSDNPARILTAAGDGAGREPPLGGVLSAARGRRRPGSSTAGDASPARPSSAALRSPRRRRRSAASPWPAGRPTRSPPGAPNWPTTVAVGNLDGGQVERGRQVDDDRVDLAVLQRRDDVVGVVEDFRLARRVDHFFDRFEAGGADLDADLGVLQVGERFGLRGFGVLQRDDRLVGGVVREPRSRPPFRAAA